jgi:hypothetical protein
MSFRLSLGHRKRSQIFHSEGHVPVKRADGHALLEARQVDLSDYELRAVVPLLSRLCQPLHRNRQIYCKPVRAEAISVPNAVVRSSYGIKISFCGVTSLVDVLGTSAPELEREPGIHFHAIALTVEAGQIELSTGVALSYGSLVPLYSFFHVWRVVPITLLVTCHGVELSIGVSTFFCRSQIPGRRLHLVTLDSIALTVKSAKVVLAPDVPTLCCHATKLECQREVSGHALVAKIVTGINESLRLSVPLLGHRQLRSKCLAGRLHTSTVDGGGERPKLS